MEENSRGPRANGRPERPAGARRVAARAEGGARRTLASRRLATRPGSIPQWVYVAMIALPAAGIVFVLLLSAFRGRPSEGVQAPVDPNQEVTELERLIPDLERGYRETALLLQKGDSRGQAKTEELRARLQNWIDRWDALFEDKRDSEGRALPEYRGYGAVRARVNVLLQDLNKIAPF